MTNDAVSDERRGAERYTWTDRARNTKPEELPLRVEFTPSPDICDISASGLLVRGLSTPAPSLTLAIDNGTSVATVPLALKDERPHGFVFETSTEQRPIVDDALVYFVQQGWLTRTDATAPAPRRGRQPTTHLRVLPDDDCFLGASCPVAPDRCENCGLSVPAVYNLHCECGHPRLVPNVLAACAPTERQAVIQAFSTRTRDLSDEQLVDAQALLRDSVAVLACNPKLLLSVLWGITKIPNYHEAVARGYRAPDGPEWAYLRDVIDQALFPGYKDDIRFAALSLDGRGVRRFGNCFVQLKSNILREKANVFIENSFFFAQDFTFRELQEGLRGARAAWPHREYLAMAKHPEAFREPFTRGSVAATLVVDGTEPPDDDFVEVHVYGPLGVESFASISVPQSEPERDLIEQQCRKHSIRFEARPS